MLPSRLVAVALVVLMAATVSAPLLAAERVRVNVLLIVSEDNGPELGCYGDPWARTPNLDQLAKSGVRFEKAFVPYSVCSPSRAAFLTGLHPHQNGQIGLATHKFAMYREDTPNLATLLKSIGYRTGLIGKLHVNPESAFPFDYRTITGANFQRRESVDRYAQAASQFFAQAGDQPFFLSVNFPDAHLPFLRQANGRPEMPLTGADVKPMPWVGVDSPRLREQVANYYNCLTRLDTGIGLLLGELEKAELADNTLVIYIGDHGAQFPRGKGTVYEGGLRVPMIVRYPGSMKAGVVRQELVSTLDIMPTVLSAAGHKTLAGLPGLSLQPLLLGKPAPPFWRTYVHALTTGAFPRACVVQQSIRDKRFKLISTPQPQENHEARTYLDPTHPNFVISGATPQEQSAAQDFVQRAFRRWRSPPRYELYDLEDDPHEWRDLANDPEHEDVKRRMIAAMQDWQRKTKDPFLDPGNVSEFVSQQMSNRDLGYRRRADFRWSYLDTFPLWKSRRGEDR